MMSEFDDYPAKRLKSDSSNRDQSFNADESYYNVGSNTQDAAGGNLSSKKTDFEAKPNHILLITVLNPVYPITTDVLHTICSPSGSVVRIVIFKKNGVQAMVEFDSIETARRAKQSLDGCDIYAGCCTLKIEFAKPSKLNVYKNDSETWDYTNNNLGKPVPSNRPFLLTEPPAGYGPSNNNAPHNVDRGMPYHNQGYNPYMSGSSRTEGILPQPHDPYGVPNAPNGYGQDPYSGNGYSMATHRPAFVPGKPLLPPALVMQHGAVIMAYGLSPNMNCDTLFNVLCLYGNVFRIKFLKSKVGCAMIQMGDPLAAERAVSNLNNSTFFDCKMQLGYSKQTCLTEMQASFELPDGSPSFKDFLGNKNNRFSSPEAAKKNRIIPPSKVLHFFNTPVSITEEEMRKVFEDKNAKVPTSITLFQSKNKSERSSSGLLLFESVSDALEGLALCNHSLIKNPNGKFPYVLKLCFSTSNVE